ncbi:hypothetical protein NliqN6_4772 [Naganishia liquefaciens]|uniref:COX assembly mitochondrial protein n=1 Tax=Naganishia liquefaciens TaxID=104408 RepID=A0A8H3TW86_9TREE|nr:hypothetical protein NliqN6_4772 [Naganishia liquefaciens]
METLSRREESDLLERGKKEAMKHCEDIVKDFADCASGRTFSVIFACNGKLNDMKSCMKDYLSLERIDGMKRDYILNREQHREEAIREARNPTRKH